MATSKVHTLCILSASSGSCSHHSAIAYCTQHLQAKHNTNRLPHYMHRHCRLTHPLPPPPKTHTYTIAPLLF
jgi:hypothetical protein